MKIGSCELPDSALNHHVAALGKTGSGKTYAMKGIVEKLLEAGKRVCILDPTGAWWGLTSSADGKSAGFPVTIFGGTHGHVPINEHAGQALGELVGTSNFPSVIDLSETTLGERHRFVERFAEHLFRVNKQPLHLIIDEADEFAPQSGAPGTERMLGAIDRIVRRGRIKGFRVMLISQRPAVLNKNVLTQAETLVAMRLPSSQDRKAVELWIKGQADEDQAAEVMGSLASLQRGEGWIWSPAANVLSRVKFPKLTTFDSSRTPEDGEQIQAPKKLAEVDLTAVRAALAEAVKEAAENDPKSLRARIKDLEKEVAGRGLAANVGIQSETIAQLERKVQVLEATLDACGAESAERTQRMIYRLFDRATHIADQVTRDIGGIVQAIKDERTALEQRGPSEIPRNPTNPIAKSHTPPRPPTPGKRSPHERILDAIAWWQATGIDRPTRVQVGCVARYTPSGGTFTRYVSALSSEGLVAYPDSGTITLTPAGSASAMAPECAPSLASLHDGVRSILDGPHRKILDVLLHACGREVGRTEVAERAGYEATGGTFNRYVSHLSSLGLIRYPKRTTVAAAPILFPEGLT